MSGQYTSVAKLVPDKSPYKDQNDKNIRPEIFQTGHKFLTKKISGTLMGAKFIDRQYIFGYLLLWLGRNELVLEDIFHPD